MTTGDIVAGLLVAVVGIGIAATRGDGDPVPAMSPALAGSHVAPPQAPTPVAPVERVASVRSRFVNRSTLEVWGSAHAPDGTTVRLRIRSGAARHVARVPVASGRFYDVVRLPPRLRGRRVSIRAGISR